MATKKSGDATISLPPPPSREPQMTRWMDLFYRLGGPGAYIYDEDFMGWWADQMIDINNYPYSRMDFRGDPNLPLPPGTQCRAIGMTLLFF